MKVFILLSVFAVALARECGDNQHYESCGTACPLTCENYKNPPKFCILMCNPGCHCDEGFVKAKDNSCVRPEQCEAQGVSVSSKVMLITRYPRVGSPLQIDCVIKGPQDAKVTWQFRNGQLIADERRQIFSNHTIFITKAEKSDSGPYTCTVRYPSSVSTSSVYVEVEGVQSGCGENERYFECGSACPLTCQNYRYPPKPCPASCVSGCHCERGFVRSQDGRCVRPERCSDKLSRNEICHLPVDEGYCRAYLRSYYYNKRTERCERFIYGGCGGNENNFSTLEACEKTCGLNEICQLPPDEGSCRAFFRNYYYNVKTGRCERLIYSGCEGNANNFRTLEDCEETCGSY